MYAEYDLEILLSKKKPITLNCQNILARHFLTLKMIMRKAQVMHISFWCDITDETSCHNPYLPVCKMTIWDTLPAPPNKIWYKKIFHYEFHTHNTKCMSQSIYLYQSVSLSPPSVSALIFLTLTLDISILFCAIPQHITSFIQCTRYTALFITPLTLSVLAEY
jgi:hypothetical protein